MGIQIGATAPDFTLYNTEKNKISLSDFHGKNVLLLFFPLAFTSTCTTELCSVRDNMDVYSKLNAEIIGISIDSLFVLDKYKKENNFDFTLLSDFNKTTAAAYECLFESFSFDMQGVTKRAAFVIDREGIVRYEEVLDNAGQLPNFDAIRECLNTLN
jgi:peroxiredoxin